MKIRKGDELSEIIKILKGVLQGEILSPILFALFLRDLEEFFIRKGIRGVSATHLVEILLLAYADDIVILSDSYIGMKKIISLLLEYCTLNQLTLNANKTKVILFKKGGFKPQKHFSFGTEQIEYAKEYDYLGVRFFQSGKFETASRCFISKAKSASAATISLIYKMKLNSFEIYIKLFNSLVNSIILYAAPVYAIKLERVQIQYYKRLLNIPFCSPNYAVRLETGIKHISLVVLKFILNWLIRIGKMSSLRYPKVCLIKSITDAYRDRDNNKSKFNWASKVLDLFFKPIGKEEIFKNFTFDSVISQKREILKLFSEFLRSQDLERYQKSSSLYISI